MNLKYTLPTIFVFLITIYSANSQVQIKVNDKKPIVSPPPASIQNQDERNLWIAKHYWDKVNFSNKKVTSPEYINTFISTYTYHLAIIPNDTAVVYIDQILEKAKSTYEEAYDYLSSSLHEVYDNLVSAYRDDERLTAVLENILANKKMTESERENYKFRLEMAKKNSRGSQATNIGFINIANKPDSLYNIDAEVIMLMFYSPGCHACEETEAKIKSSAIINNWLESGDLKILAYAPEADKDTWTEYQSHIPAAWINGYDPKMSVWYKRLYDIKGFPTIYLLDKNKKVLIKDTSIPQVEDYLMEQAMTLPVLE